MPLRLILLVLRRLLPDLIQVYSVLAVGRFGAFCRLAWALHSKLFVLGAVTDFTGDICFGLVGLPWGPASRIVVLIGLLHLSLQFEFVDGI